jgi:spectinomycin phosphotransferase
VSAESALPARGADEVRVAALLGDRYGLSVERVAPAPRGWTGETYRADTRGGGRVFVKVYPRQRLPPTAAGSLPVLAELHRLGLAEVSRPLPSASGALHEWLGDDLVVVFAHIDAAQLPFAFGGERAGDLLARVHALSARVTTPAARERFAPPYADELWPTLALARAEPGADEPRRGLRRFLDAQEGALEEGWAAFQEIARACRAASFEMVVTHGDWPFNLLEGADATLHLVDWDELLLAPAERDTWYADGEAEFWRAYRARRPGHAESALATGFYVHNRYFEELVSFCKDILGDDPPERRAAVLDIVTGNWMAALRARMARVTRP